MGTDIENNSLPTGSTPILFSLAGLLILNTVPFGKNPFNYTVNDKVCQ